ncbi:MAG: peptidase [Deltaproteobacteria bacterium CG07_land_8_20_14_0_80_38_7]|nr:MAG: peptidase [Deltaproteobacteria bacterium CG07_land_8_20_14_0_80_38_7]
MNKKRFSLWMLVLTSFITATLVIICMTKSEMLNASVSSDKIYHISNEENQVVPASWLGNSRPNTFADLAEKVQAAVVNINTSTTLNGRGYHKFGQRDPFFDDFFEKFFRGVPEQKQRSLGSGFIINEKGDILTNNHVVSMADEIEVKLADGRKFKAEIIGRDEKTDIALIRIKNSGEALPYVNLGDSDKMRSGDWVMAIGNPFGLEHTVTAGVVSATGRIIGGGTLAKFIQTDASINPGNSGGPLFNLNGEVIGINAMIQVGAQGIGFAIPINLAKSMLPQLESKGSVTRGWLGVGIQDITPELAKSFNLPNEKGVLIAEVFPNSPASKYGLQRGDVVIQLDNTKIENPYDLSIAIGSAAPDSTIVLKLIREGKEKELKITIGKDAEESSRQIGIQQDYSSKADNIGLVIKKIEQDDIVKFGLSKDITGVLVKRVEPNSSAENANIRTGDAIVEINGNRISGVGEYNKIIEKIQNGDIVRILIKRGDASVYIAFRA